MSNPIAAPDAVSPLVRRSWLACCLHQIFELSLFFKGLFAAIELIGGAVLYLVSTDRIVALVSYFTLAEITEDPQDRIASSLLRAAEGFSLGSKDFYGLYLASHGLIKLVLVAGLVRGARWSYPAAVVVLSLFVAYQLYRYSYDGSPALLALSAFDAMLVALICREWRVRWLRDRASHTGSG